MRGGARAGAGRPRRWSVAHDAALREVFAAATETPRVAEARRALDERGLGDVSDATIRRGIVRAGLEGGASRTGSVLS